MSELLSPLRYTAEPMAEPRNNSSSQITNGVTYSVRYVGSIPIETSMKMLEFDVRTALAKECIFRICEAAGYVSTHKKRHVDKRIKSLLTENQKPNLCKAGENVDLIISTKCITVVSSDTQEALFFHSIPCISFASGGDEETAEFVCYVGKEEYQGRHCLVFECGITLAQQVLATIGNAFSTRVQEFHHQAEHGATTSPQSSSQTEFSPSFGQVRIGIPDDPSSSAHLVKSRCGAPVNFDPTPVPPPRNRGAGHVYVNDSALNPGNSGTAWRDEALKKEVWYHGAISRPEAEALLNSNGDFLVRRKETEDQYVLTGMQNGAPRHLLLIDDKGEVRTRDRKFQSISHLINYHRDNNLPITSTESVLVLKTAVLRGNPS